MHPRIAITFIFLAGMALGAQAASFDCTMRGSLSLHCERARYWISDGDTRTTICSLFSAASAVGSGTRIWLRLAAGPAPLPAAADRS